MRRDGFDLVVIGGGPAGVAGALAAAAFGKSVALVEKAPHVGGAGLHTGTVPSKALRESALVISGWRARKLLGLDLALKREATISDLTRHSQQVQRALEEEVEERMRDRRIETIRGKASFSGAHRVRVEQHGGGELILHGERILVATGSSPVRPPEFPFEHPRVHDSDEILEIAEPPERLAVVGAGVIGAEYACTFAALGAEVHVVDGREGLLSFLDHEVSDTITSAMQDAGVRFHWKERVISCAPCAAGASTPSGGIELSLSSGARLTVTDVLVAAGRSSNTGSLNLAAAGIAPGRRGLVPVNEVFQTEVPHIYAAGDVIGPPALASTGMEQARLAVSHAFGLWEKVAAPILPTGIYTIPEAAMVGLTEQGAREAGIDYLVGRAAYRRNARGRLMGDERGFLKLIVRRHDMRLLGVHVVGEQATEAVHIGLMAMLHDADLELFNRACFNFPSLGDLYKQATYDVLLQSLQAGDSR